MVEKDLLSALTNWETTSEDVGRVFEKVRESMWRGGEIMWRRGGK